MRTNAYSNPNDGFEDSVDMGLIEFEIRAFGQDVIDAFRTFNPKDAAEHVRSLFGLASYNSPINTVYVNGRPFRAEFAAEFFDRTAAQRKAEVDAFSESGVV
jgi:hypothetical protein